MKNLFGALLLTGSALLATTAALAQTAPDLPAPGQPTQAQVPQSQASAALARKSKQAAPAKQLTPEQEEQERQIRLLEARSGNTSYSAGSGSVFRQTDNANGAFTLRKYKSMPGQEEKRGVSKRIVPGGVTHGEPLTSGGGKKKRNFFSF